MIDRNLNQQLVIGEIFKLSLGYSLFNKPPYTN